MRYINLFPMEDVQIAHLLHPMDVIFSIRLTVHVYAWTVIELIKRMVVLNF